MIRNGAVDNVLSHLSADQAGLKLKNVSQGGNWQGEKWLEQQMREGDVAKKWKDRYGGGGSEFRASSSGCECQPAQTANTLPLVP